MTTAPNNKREFGPMASNDGPGRMPGLRTWIVGGGLLVLVLGGYWYFNNMAQDTNAQRSAAAPVRVAHVEKRDMPVIARSLGTLVAYDTVELTARVQGTLERAEFKEGQLVKKGDLMFVIDPRPFEAALAQVEATYRKDQAQLQNALLDEKRYTALVKEGAISTQVRDTADANAAVLSATVAADKAAADIARLNVEYCYVRSPVDGKTGPMLIQPGNMINGPASPAAPLIEIAQVRPIKVSFTLPQAELPRIQARQKSGRLLAILDARDGAGRTLQAPVDFVSDAVSNQTGTIELRATFPNADLSLVPGQLINVTVQLNDIPAALIVPRDAVNNGPNGTFVFAVKDGRAVEVPVSTLTDDGANAAVSGALAAGDIVVVEGQLRVVPGGDVRVISMPPSAAGAPMRVGL